MSMPMPVPMPNGLGGSTVTNTDVDTTAPTSMSPSVSTSSVPSSAPSSSSTLELDGDGDAVIISRLEGDSNASNRPRSLTQGQTAVIAIISLAVCAALAIGLLVLRQQTRGRPRHMVRFLRGRIVPHKFLFLRCWMVPRKSVILLRRYRRDSRHFTGLACTMYNIF